MFNGLIVKLREILDQQPQDCLLCHQISTPLICDTCCQDLQLFEYNKNSQNLMLTPNICRALSDCSFPVLKALALYQWPLSQLITQLKFNHRLINAKALAELFYQQIIQYSQTLPQVLIPVPLHKQRYLERHYNQALLLAKHIGQRANIEVDSNLCVRHKYTQAQTNCSAAQRRNNLRQVFQINGLRPYQHIAIIDDVITTGATADSLFKSLRQVLPQARIEIWAICISLPHR